MTANVIQSARSVGSTFDAPRPTRLLVTRQNPVNRRYFAVGFLSEDGSHGFRFDYLRSAAETPDFRPLPGLSRTDTSHVSETLFPLFAERIMSSRRPDREATVKALGLGLDAAPFEILARGGGRRVGDTIELTPAPAPDAQGQLTIPFLVHGIRHMDAVAEDAIERLGLGSSLMLIPEPDNPMNEKALIVADRAGQQLGYVPDPLLSVVEQISDQRVDVARVNPLAMGFHLRLLVVLHGRLSPDSHAFSGPQWETVRSLPAAR